MEVVGVEIYVEDLVVLGFVVNGVLWSFVEFSGCGLKRKMNWSVWSEFWFSLLVLICEFT